MLPHVVCTTDHEGEMNNSSLPFNNTSLQVMMQVINIIMFETIYKGTVPQWFNPESKEHNERLALEYFPELEKVQGHPWLMKFPNGEVALLRSWTPDRDTHYEKNLSSYSLKERNYGQAYQINMCVGVGVAIMPWRP